VAVLRGLLAPVSGTPVNFVNAPSLARERGITVNELKTTEAKDFTNFIEIEGLQDHDRNYIMGTLFGNRDPRIVRINEFPLDAEPKGYMLFIHNEDRPGVVGMLGTLLGRNNVNIAEMTLGRIKRHRKIMALTVIHTDEEVPFKVLQEIKKSPTILDAKLVKL
jgi:D-3-phosphoglycerate dehydrogenase